MERLTHFPITQANFKWLIFICFTVFILVSCVTPPPKPPDMSELQIREIQTRQYENANYIEAIKAVVASLQDQEFIITSANESLGLVTAYKDIEEKDQWTEFWVGPKGSYQTIRRIEANATIRHESKVIKIRINLIAKGITNTGGVVWTRPIYDSEAYQRIFSKIDKAIFIEKEKI
ncbi:MAG: hypothetical protein RMI30_00380 [Thermodesulfovibrio sp.]|nr:hypothetical protein [Thermodesulfovibrio sp.]MDW7997898.1 hypothetical protein [Thermodesulfovibrio sp.]